MDVDDGALAAARELVPRADAEPDRVRDLAEAQLGTDPGVELDAMQAIVAWALGLALRHLRDIPQSIAWLTAARAAFPPGTDDHTTVSLSLAGSLAYAGDFVDAAQVLDDAEPSAALAGRVGYQRAAIAERLGSVDEAQQGYGAALAAFEASGDLLGEAHSLMGLGLIDVASGTPTRALARFALARLHYSELGAELLAVLAGHNIGYAATRAGHLGLAAAELDRAQARLSVMGEPFAETALDRVENFLLLGADRAAAELAHDALDRLADGGVDADRAEMLVGLGSALGAAGHRALADAAFSAAVRLVEAQGRQGWSELIEVRRAALDPHVDVEHLGAVADRLRTGGFDALALEAETKIVETLACDGPEPAGRSLVALDRLRALPRGNTRRLLATALYAARRGRDAEALGASLGGVERLRAEARTTIDLGVRTGIVRQQARFVRIGAGAARRLGDGEAIVVLARSVQGAIFERVLDEASRDRSAITEMIRADVDDVDRWRAVIGDGADEVELDHGSDTGAESVTGSADGPLIHAVLDDGDAISVATIGEGACRLLPSPDRGPLIDALRRHRMLLVEAMHSVDGAYGEQLRRSRKLVADHLPWLERPDGLVVAAVGEIAAAPWASLASSPVHLALVPTPTAPVGVGPVTVAVGPDLVSGVGEVAEVGGRAGASVMSAATPDDVVALASPPILHVCSHGDRDVDSPLLSSYRLHGGELTGFAVAVVPSPPQLVVSTACRAGPVADRGSVVADGLPVAWLAAGSSCVVAPTEAIPDTEATTRFVRAFYDALDDGRSPAAAIHAARADSLVAEAFLAVGGWPTSSPLPGH